MVKSWLVQDQTVLGKDYSNLLIADSLLKTIWFINAPCYGNEALTSPKANELAIPEQTATGKGKLNPFMAGSLPKTTKPTFRSIRKRTNPVTDQAKEIKHLKAQIKKLKKKAKPVITHHKAWMKSVSMKQRLTGKKSLKKKWMQKESVSKQGRKSAKSTPTAHTDQVFDDVDVNDAMDYMETDAYMQKGVSTEDQVSTVKPDEGTAEPKDGTSYESTAPTYVFRDDETIAEFLVSMSQNKAKQKGVEIKDAEDSDRPRATSTRSVLTLKPLPKIDPKDKGKKVLEEEAESDAESEGVDEAERKFDQLAKDEEIARKVQEDWEVDEEMKKLAEEEAIKAAVIQDFDDIQARIEANRLLAARLQEEERETFTVEERAKFLYDTIAAQRRFLAQQRAAAIRSRPPTRTQLRNQIMTYLKHVGGKKHADLKNKNFDEIQVLYKKVKMSDKDFIAIGSAEDERQIKEMNEESKDPKKKRVIIETPREEDTEKVLAKQEVTEQGTKKRKSGHVKMIARKSPRPQPDDSDDEYRKYLRIVTFDSTLDSEIMETKYFVSKLHKVSSPDGDYLVVYRVNGHFRAFNYLIKVLHIFYRQDLFYLYDLVMKQYSEITPEGIELILWGDLKIMMESSTKENNQGNFWNNQQDWEIISWRLYEACGVCILEFKDGTVIYMLVERRYPISKELLQRMLDLGLEVEEESTAALHLNYLKEQTLCKLKVKIYSVNDPTTFTSQNLAFLSSENTSSTNEVSTVSGDFGVSTAGGISQIDEDELEELDLRWQVAMLTVRVKKFIQKTGRNLDFKEKRLALVAQDGLGGYDWSNDFIVEPVNYAIMAISSSSSSSSLTMREIKINNLNLELEKVVKERDELKLNIEKWEESSKNLDELLKSQMSDKDKTGLGYGTQLNEMSNNSETDSEISLSVFDVRSSDEENTPVNDRFSKADGFHDVPSPITGNFLTPRADISFAGLDEYAIRKKIIESNTTDLNTKTSETIGKINEANTQKPKTVYESVNRDKVIIED
ncbi:hypothetical protein Tco_1063976 [Tanacetum coccineum]